MRKTLLTVAILLSCFIGLPAWFIIRMMNENAAWYFMAIGFYFFFAGIGISFVSGFCFEWLPIEMKILKKIAIISMITLISGIMVAGGMWLVDIKDFINSLYLSLIMVPTCLLFGRIFYFVRYHLPSRKRRKFAY